MLALTFSSVFTVEKIVWIIAALIVLFGALGVVVIAENPVHSALSLVATLFGVALMFILQEAYFLAAIQVIVYAGAIVVLFLFVIMLLGVDRFELLGRDRTPWRRPVAAVAAAGVAVLVCVGALATTTKVTGDPSVSGRLDPERDVLALGKVLFTKYVWAFEITGVLLTVAVVGAVVLARKPSGDAVDLDEFPADEPDPADEPNPADDADDAAEVDA